MNAICPKCRERHTNRERECPKKPDDSSSGGDMATSMLIGMATDNALIGAAVGGSIMGGILGDMASPIDGGGGGFF